MGQFSDDQVWERVTYIDVDVDLKAFHKYSSANPLYFSREKRSAVVLVKMRELRLVTMRVIVAREAVGEKEDRYLAAVGEYWKMLKVWVRGQGGR
jgi:hypothetical protein